MRQILALAFAVLAAAPTVRAEAEDSVILWFEYTDSDTMIQNLGGGTTSAANLVGQGSAAGVTVNGIRVKATDASGASTYLNLMGEEDWTTWIELPGLEVDSSGALTEIWDAGPTYANVAGYTDASYTFMIELGNYSDNGDWIVLATSQSDTFANLDKAGFVNHGAIDMHQEQEWTGGSYTVPEPSGGVLLLIGAGLLALRRKRRPNV